MEASLKKGSGVERVKEWAELAFKGALACLQRHNHAAHAHRLRSDIWP